MADAERFTRLQKRIWDAIGVDHAGGMIEPGENIRALAAVIGGIVAQAPSEIQRELMFLTGVWIGEAQSSSERELAERKRAS